MEVLPSVASWVTATVGPIAERLFDVSHLSSVTGLRLADGRRVVVKVRGGVERAQACVAGQKALQEDGFPAPAPLSPVVEIEALAVHVEEFVAGTRHSVTATESGADALATLLADLVVRSRRLHLPPPEPPPLWLAWDHAGPGAWPPLEERPPHPDALEPEGWLADIVDRVRRRLSEPEGEFVVAHGDWEAQNMAQRADGQIVVHDWDSLAHRPEAAIVGAAAATFASGPDQPTLSPIDVTDHFIEAYQREATRTFTTAEREVAWAAGMWLAAHNARMELLYGKPRVVHARLAEEAPERLERAGA